MYAGKPLRRATLRAIYGSSLHPISVSLVLLGSRDLVEQYQISFVTFWKFCVDILNLRKKIRKPHPLRQRPRDIGEIAELHYHFGVLWFVVLLDLFQICICAYGCDVSSIIIPLSLIFLNG